MPIYEDDQFGRRGLPRPLPRAQVPSWFGGHCNTSNLITIQVPIIGRMYVHKRVADAFRLVLTEIDKAGKGNLIDRSDYGGTYNCRQVRGGSSWSPHAWAIAVDLNVHAHFVNGREVKLTTTNYQTNRDRIAPSLRDLAPFFQRWGFSWGGNWISPIDPMHFEATDITVLLLEGKPVPNAFMERCLPVDKPEVDIDLWALPQVEKVIARGIMSKGTDGRFRGRDPLTRQEAAVIADRVEKETDEKIAAAIKKLKEEQG